MQNDEEIGIGSVVEDMGKVAIISKIIPYGTMDTDFDAIKWRTNYELTYVDGDVQIIAKKTFDKLVIRGDIIILKK